MREFFLGIDVGGTNIKLMVMERTGDVLGKRSIPTCAEQGYERISSRMIAAVEEIFEREGIGRPERRILSAGMGLPGTVDRREQKTVRLTKLHWDGFNPCEKIGRYFDAPAVIENDANVNAFGEYSFGNPGKKQNLVLVTLGTGVGCGVILEGKIFGGASNMAAELGHLVVVPDDGAVCLCGKRGHLEAYCSGTALEREALELTKWTDTLLSGYIEEAGGIYDNRMVVRGAKEGDRVCRELLDRFSHYLSIGIANVMTMFNPELILLGGGLSGAGKWILDPVNEACRNLVLSPQSLCPVEQAGLGPEAGMYGACALAREIFEKGGEDQR